MTIKKRYEGLQTLCGVMKDEACHFLTLCSIADEYNQSKGKPFIDLIDAVRTAMDNKWMDNEFTVTVLGSCDILGYLTGKKWTRKEVDKLPVIRDNDYTEAVWYNPKTEYHHYRRRSFDTLAYSYTVANGYIEKYYIYTVED